MTRTESALPDEGWYPDPRDERRLRWWDGAGWTRHTAERRRAPAAEPEPEPAVAEPEPDPVVPAERVSLFDTERRPAAEPDRGVERGAEREPLRRPDHGPDREPERAVAAVPAPSSEALRTPQLLAAGGAAALIVSLFLTWYTLQLGVGGGTVAVPLASNAFQWMSGTALVLGLLAFGVLAVVMGSFAELPFAPRLRQLLVPAAIVWPAAAVVVIAYRMIDPPLLPGSDPALNYQGTLSTGPWIALLCALTMTGGAYLFVRAARAAGAADR